MNTVTVNGKLSHQLMYTSSC